MCIIQFLIDANTANMQVGFPAHITNISVCCHSNSLKGQKSFHQRKGQILVLWLCRMYCGKSLRSWGRYSEGVSEETDNSSLWRPQEVLTGPHYVMLTRGQKESESGVNGAC